MNRKINVSVIIPVKKINQYIHQSIPILLNQKEILEIIIVVDKKDIFNESKIKIINSGSIGPAQKRDLAAKVAKGEILAFIDDDAYPEKNWLKNALIHFKNNKVAAVGGPAITPSSNSNFQKAFGAVAESFFGGGGARNRFLSIGKTKLIDDWPTVNLLVNNAVFKRIGGFDTHYWPGEDTKFCLDIINKGYQIIYEPKAIVYHHRRANLSNYLKQVGNYGIHRGYFVKKFPKTSMRLWYFIPSLFIIYLLSIISIWILNIQFNNIRSLYAPLIIYLFGLILDGFIISLRWNNIIIGMLSIPLIFLTHIWYGIRFLQGLLINKLSD